MKNISEQIDYSNPESMNLEEFFRYKDGEGDNYSETEQKLLYKYIEQMKELKKELGVKSFKELEEPDFTKGKDLKVLIVPMRKLKEVMQRIDKAMREHKFSDVISGKTEKGERISFEIKEQLERWRKFYQEHNIDWVELPEEIKITEEQQKEMARVIKELALEKAEDIEILIIPEGLADNGDKYEALHKKMTKGYVKSYQNKEFIEEGGFKGLKNKSDELRIIITKRVKDIKNDKVFKETLNKSVDDLEREEGIFNKKGFRGIDMMTYLVWQRKHFEETGTHLDKDCLTWITENGRPASGRAPCVDWYSGDDYMRFLSKDRNYRVDYGDHFLGCRLAGSFEIEESK